MSIFQSIRKRINKILAPFGVEVIRSKNKVLELNLYTEVSRPEVPCYLNVGAGDFYHPYWHNLDMPNDYYADWQRGKLHILHDLTSLHALPLRNDSLKIAYTSHVIEHLDNESVQHLFSEVYRCLEPGGIFRVTCPDMDLEYDAYSRGDRHFWREANAYGIFNKSLEQGFLDHFASCLTETHPGSANKLSDLEVRNVFLSSTKEDAFDIIIKKIPKDMQKIYPGDHVNWFNLEKITRLLQNSQFKSVCDSRFGQSKHHILRNTRLFDSTCPGLSLYVECQK